MNFFYYYCYFFDKFLYFCNWTVFARPKLSQLDVFFRDNQVGSLRRAECSEVTYLTYLYEAGVGWESQSRHRRRLSTLCLRLPVILQIHSIFWS